MGVREPCRYVYLWEPSSDFVRWEFTSETAVGMLYWSYHAHDLPITETGERSLGMRLHENRWEEPGNEAAWKQVGGAWEWGCTETGGKSLGMRLHGNRWEEPGNEAAHYESEVFVWECHECIMLTRLCGHHSQERYCHWGWRMEMSMILSPHRRCHCCSFILVKRLLCFLVRYGGAMIYVWHR